MTGKIMKEAYIRPETVTVLMEPECGAVICSSLFGNPGIDDRGTEED